ncbi:MAG TPA: sulfite dehydrogenase, partial [Roseiarcus sp.]|nr:sulfite dehydrogenase [Roseiarcus sp.]
MGSLAAVSAAAASSDNLPPHIPVWQTGPGGEVMSPPYGLPSKFEASVVRRERSGGSASPTRQAAVSVTPLQDLHGVITPNGLHYERHHAGVPTIDPQ